MTLARLPTMCFVNADNSKSYLFSFYLKFSVLSCTILKNPVLFLYRHLEVTLIINPNKTIYRSKPREVYLGAGCTLALSWPTTSRSTTNARAEPWTLPSPVAWRTCQARSFETTESPASCSSAAPAHCCPLRTCSWHRGRSLSHSVLHLYSDEEIRIVNLSSTVILYAVPI